MHEILGQDRALETLLAAWRVGRVHHAWVFSGPKGIGKFTTAIAFARILLDPDAGTAAGSPFAAPSASRVATLVEAGTHPDLHVIRKELALYSANPDLRGRKLMNLPLDVLREHMIGGRTSDDRFHEAPAWRTATLGHGKVFIIDEAELIDDLGQNTLLKTLEEPPPRTHIILVTSRADRLLPTIRSRCQHVAFGALDERSMTRWLDVHYPSADPRERAWAAEFAEGRPGLAAIALEHEFRGWHEELSPMLDRLESAHYPARMGEKLAELIETYATAAVKGNRNASKDAANKEGAEHVLGLLAFHVRRRLREACDAGAPADRSLRAIDLLADAESQLRSNVNMKHVLENLVAQWSNQAADQPALTR